MLGHYCAQFKLFIFPHIAICYRMLQDIVDTGNDGYKFIKLDSGMTEVKIMNYFMELMF